MASRTQIVCLCEGEKGECIDQVFINKLIKCLDPNWLRPWSGSNVVRPQPCGGRAQVIKRTPGELKICLSRGDNATLMVWADCDDDCADGEALKTVFNSTSNAMRYRKSRSGTNAGSSFRNQAGRCCRRFAMSFETANSPE